MSDREVIRRHSRSFAMAARLLPKEARARAEALYAWCRAADDRIDHAPNRPTAEAALAELHAEVANVYARRQVTTPAGDALRRAVHACGILSEYPLELLAGLAMDLHGTRYATHAELLLYCHRVAGVVGWMMCHALGVSNDDALRHAGHLGIAMQLTNIARDVAEDWKRGRLYLPAEWLAWVPGPGELLPDDLAGPAVRRCLELADRYYESGNAGLRYLSPRCRPAVQLAASLYQSIGHEIAEWGYRPSRGRAVVSTRRKLAWLVRTTLPALPYLLASSGPARPPAARGTFALLPDPQPSSSSPVSSMKSVTKSWRDAASTVSFALSLTAILAAALFTTVALNPKAVDYDILPWCYATACLLSSPLFYALSCRFGVTSESARSQNE